MANNPDSIRLARFPTNVNDEIEKNVRWLATEKKERVRGRRKDGSISWSIGSRRTTQDRNNDDDEALSGHSRVVVYHGFHNSRRRPGTPYLPRFALSGNDGECQWRPVGPWSMLATLGKPTWQHDCSSCLLNHHFHYLYHQHHHHHRQQQQQLLLLHLLRHARSRSIPTYSSA